MGDKEWRRLDDEALEHLLVERWLYRGLMLGVILLAAIIVSYLGARGLHSATDQAILIVAVGVALAAAAVAFVLRQHDLEIHRELRERRRARRGQS